MIICLCRAMNDHDLATALKQNSPEEILQTYVSNTDCGACVPKIIKIIQQHIESEHLLEDD